MKHEITTCPREVDVLDLIAIDQWPARADASLSAHVADCAVCSDLAVVASAFAVQASAPDLEARVPDASVVWYGARLLARTEMAQRAARPMLVVQTIAIGCLVAAAITGWQIASPLAIPWWRDLAPEAWPSWHEAGTWLENSSVRQRWLLGAAGAWAVLVPLALYLVRLADRGESQTSPPSDL